MAEANYELDLTLLNDSDAASSPLKLPTYEPAKLLPFRLDLVVGERVSELQAEYWVRCRTAGQGHSDSFEFPTEPMETSVVRPGELFRRELSLPLPEAPWSFTGELFRIEWAVVVAVRINGGRNAQHHERPFALAPRARRSVAGVM